MRNRADHFQSRKRAHWLWRTIISLIGLFLIFVGISGYRNGIFWYFSNNPRTGAFGMAPSLGIAGLGSVIFLIGALPWESWLEKKNKS
jgi:hypothetical protein